MTPRIVTRRAIAEQDPSTWWFLMLDGAITEHPTAASAKAEVERDARRLAGRDGIVVTEIEWRPLDVDTFEPPR